MLSLQRAIALRQLALCAIEKCLYSQLLMLVILPIYSQLMTEKTNLINYAIFSHTLLKSELSQETQYRHSFLTTFCTFASSTEVFDLLVERYEMNHPEGLTAEEFDEWLEKKHRPVQKR